MPHHCTALLCFWCNKHASRSRYIECRQQLSNCSVWQHHWGWSGMWWMWLDFFLNCYFFQFFWIFFSNIVTSLCWKKQKFYDPLLSRESLDEILFFIEESVTERLEHLFMLWHYKVWCSSVCLFLVGFFPPKTKIVITLSNQNNLMKNI